MSLCLRDWKMIAKTTNKDPLGSLALWIVEHLGFASLSWLWMRTLNRSSHCVEYFVFSGFRKDNEGVFRNFFFYIVSWGTWVLVPSDHSPWRAFEVGSGPVSSRCFHMGWATWWEDIVKSRANFFLLLPTESCKLCALPVNHPSLHLHSSPSIEMICCQFLRCSTLLHASGSLDVFLPLPRKLFPSILPFRAQLKHYFLKEAILDPPDLGPLL